MTFSLSESILNFKRSSLLPNHLLYFSYSKAHLKRNSIAQLFQRHYYISYRTIWNIEYIILQLESRLLIFQFRLYFAPFFIFLFSSTPLASINQLWPFAVLGSPCSFHPTSVLLCLPSFLFRVTVSTQCHHIRVKPTLIYLLMYIFGLAFSTEFLLFCFLWYF